MSLLKPALAAFVKTPGVSPIKTRLARDLGRERAEHFYNLSVKAVEETLMDVAERADCDVYWAVAEKAAVSAECWQQFSTVFQGNGNLGDRLHNVFSGLHLFHSAVVAIGADAPQLTSQLLMSAIDAVKVRQTHPSYVIGRCHDGGFYLFGTNVQLAKSVWDAIPWGGPGVAAALVAQLDGSGMRRELRVLSDVDQAEDLRRLSQEFEQNGPLTASQQAVFKWALDTTGCPPT